MRGPFSSPRLPVWTAAALATALAIWLGLQLGHGDYKTTAIGAAGALLVVAIVAWQTKAWLLIPLGMSAEIGVLPLGQATLSSSEVLTLVVFASFLVLVFRRRQTVVFWKWQNLFVLLYFAWAAMIYMSNPAGALTMGADVAGAHRYFRILIALLALVVVSNQQVSERDARWIIWFIMLGGVMAVLLSFRATVTQETAPSANLFYTWQQALSLPSFLLCIWLFARYRVRDVFSLDHPSRIALFGLALAVGALSGKRAGFAFLVVVPFVAAVIRREGQRVPLYAGILSLLVIVVVVGQGTTFVLPRLMQRSVVYLPGQWDQEVVDSAQDEFRTLLRESAYRTIARSPLIGKRGMAFTAQDIMEFQATGRFFGYATISSYHNTWLSMAADFGIPEAVFWGGFWLQFLVLALALVRTSQPGTFRHTLAFMLLLMLIEAIARSWTSGTSHEAPYDNWWKYGLAIALQRSLAREAQQDAAAMRPEAPA